MIERETNIACTIMARDGKGFGNQAMTAVIETRCVIAGTLENISALEMHRRVYNPSGLSPTITTCGGAYRAKNNGKD